MAWPNFAELRKRLHADAEAPASPPAKKRAPAPATEAPQDDAPADGSETPEK